MEATLLLHLSLAGRYGYFRDRPIYICRGLKMPFRELWPRVERWNWAVR